MILFFLFLVTAAILGPLYFISLRYGWDALREWKRQSDRRAIEIFRQRGIFRKKTLDRVERELAGEIFRKKTLDRVERELAGEIFRKKTLDRVERELAGERPDDTDSPTDAGRQTKKEL